MALSIEELKLQSTEYLPAREVMSSLGGGHGHGSCCLAFQSNNAGLIGVGLNLNDITVNVLNNGLFNGHDSDVVDIDDSLNYLL